MMLDRVLNYVRGNVVAYVALFVALGGTSYALSLPSNSVGSKQLKRSAVTSSKIKANAVTSSKIAPRSLLSSDFGGGQLPQGPAGPSGTSGIASVGTVDGPATSYCAGGGGSCAVASSLAVCPGGGRVVGGGFNSTAILSFVEYAKAGPSTYGVIVVNDGPNPGTITAQAVCASGPGIRVSAASAASQASASETIADRVSQLRGQLASQKR